MSFVALKVGPGNPRLGHDLLPLEGESRVLIEDYPGEFDQVMAYLRSVGKTDVAGFAPLIDRLGPRAKEIMMTTAEQFRTEGRTEGRAEALLDRLVVKFGAVPQRVVGIVRGAEAAQLRVWGARVLTADSLDEVFAE